MSSSTQHAQLADIEAWLRAMEAKVNKLKLSREQSIANIKSMEQSCEAQVRKVKKKIIDWAEKMENNTLADIRSTTKKWVDVISEQVDACSSLISQVKNDTDVAREAHSIPDKSCHQVAANKLSRMVVQMTKSVSEIEGETCRVRILFTPDQRLIADLQKTLYKALGKLNVTAIADSSVFPQLSGDSDGVEKYIRDMAVVSYTVPDVPSDYTCTTGSAFMPDGRLVLVDSYNWIDKLLLLDQDMNLAAELHLPSTPWDVAVVGNTEVIVTLPNRMKLMYVNVSATPQTGRTISVNRWCFGVAVMEEEIYVSVQDKPGNGAILVMDGEGVIRRRIGVDDLGRGRFQWPGYIAVSAQGTVYVSDRDDGISCYSRTGYELYHVSHEKMKRPRGIHLDRNGNLLVCCKNGTAGDWGFNNEIRVLKPDGTLDRVFLTSSDGLEYPHSLTYRNTDDTLIVTMMGNPSVRAYKLQ